jgi:hypothetical protein
MMGVEEHSTALSLRFLRPSASNTVATASAPWVTDEPYFALRVFEVIAG